MTYAEKLRDPRWQKLRLRVFERDEWTCRCCHNQTQELQVHHLEYFRGKNPWEYELEHLTTLCRRCHANVTEAVDFMRNFFSSAADPADLLMFQNQLKLCIEENGWSKRSMFLDFEQAIQSSLNDKYVPPSESDSDEDPENPF